VDQKIRMIGKKYIACLALCVLMLASCNPLVIKVTLGTPPAQPTARSKRSSAKQALVDALDTPTAEASVQAAPAPTLSPSATPSDGLASTGLDSGSTQTNASAPGTPAACVTSSPSAATYTVKVCLTPPAASLAGSAQIAASAEVSGETMNVQRMIFYLNGHYLITVFHAPFTFELPTTHWADGKYTLAVEALIHDGFTSQKAAQVVIIKNGLTNQPASTAQFTPATGTTPPDGAPFVVVAAGDGASGEVNETRAVNLIASARPNLFLYLGDVYEEGAPAEFDNYYGLDGAFYSRFRSITDPAIGNHEYLSSPNAAGYFSYWDNIPNYYSFDAGGWHFISLNSNDNRIGVGTGSPQYAWLKQDLANRSNACTIVYYHHPLFNIGPEGSTAALADIWTLMAQNHVSIVLNGHDHDYQRWVAMDAKGNPSPDGITEFIAGGGGHGVQKIAHTDSRLAFSSSKNPDTIGALELSLTSTAASFRYLSINGTTLDSGSIPCQK
jgi:hypothetical protein